MDLQRVSLSEIGPGSIWDGFVTKVKRKSNNNFQLFKAFKIP